MGSGKRFQWWWTRGLVFGFSVDTFPFAVTVYVHLGPVGISYGFGKAYDE